VKLYRSSYYVCFLDIFFLPEIAAEKSTIVSPFPTGLDLGVVSLLPPSLLLVAS